MIRNELRAMVNLAERLTAAEQPACLATLLSASGSTYRPLGSVMVAGPSSALLAGGVSGGCLEEYIAKRGRALDAAQPATVLTFDTDPDGQHDDTPLLGCGGTVDVLVERFTSEHLQFLRWLAAAHESDDASTALCVVDSSAATGMRVERAFGDLGDEALRLTRSAELEALRNRAIAERRSVDEPIAAGQHALVHYVAPLTRLVILGAGSDSRALCQVAHSLGWHVAVADRRARLVTLARFPEADQLVAADWWEALRQITFTPRTAVVLMTHSFADDAEILPLLAGRPAAYLGSLGPAQRRLKLLDEVEQSAGLDPTIAAMLRGPIGLDLGDRTASGIAVAVAAEIMAVFNRRPATSLSRPASAALELDAAEPESAPVAADE